VSIAAIDAACAAPLIVRVAGLPAEVIGGCELGRQVEGMRRLEGDLAAARQELVDRLYSSIRGAPAARRRFLLAVKRDCFNGRPLDRRRGTEGWADVEEVAPRLSARVLELESALADWRRDFVSSYNATVGDEIDRLVALLDDRMFSCGLALASPLVARQARRLVGRSVDTFGRDERRLAATLVRYVSRAAFKLSPFSTFTPVGLAAVRPASPGGRAVAAVRLAGGEARDVSLLRLRRFLLDQVWELLQRAPALRPYLRVALNDSRIEAADGRSTFLRPGHWRPEAGVLEHFEESLVRARLGGPWIEALEEALEAPRAVSERPTWRCLVDHLATRLGAAEAEVAGEVDRLVEVGLLHLLPPWPADEPHLEKAMLAALGGLPVDGLEPVLAPLARLVGLENGILESADPAADVEEIGRRSDELWSAAARFAGLAVERAGDERRYELYQDVLRRPAASAAEGALPVLATVDRAAAERALASVAPLARYSWLFDHRRDFLVTLGAVLARRAPGAAGCDLFTAFEAVQQHWQDYVRFVVEARGSSRWGTTWNPLGLAALAELDRFRRHAREAIGGAMADGAEGRRIDAEALDALLDDAPGAAASAPGGTCLFVQPAAADGSLWVLNRLKEGTGRYASRYTPVMSDGERRRYAAEVAARSVLAVAGEPVELLDVQCIQGDTLNVHAPQTRRLLTLPGAVSDLPLSRRLTLRDLRVTLGGDGLPELRDRDGRRYLAAHLGVGYQDYMPTVVKFLCLFGPSEMGAVFPPPWVRRQGSLEVGERTLIGSVVIHRRTWTAAGDELRALVAGATDVDAFERLGSWRLEHGIPQRVFLREAVPHPVAGRRLRPQLIDFSSPGLVRILRSAVETDARRITLVEMLPEPEAFPRDGAGRAWAVELLLDSIALRTPAAARAADVPTSRRMDLPRREWRQEIAEPTSAHT
jgi:hypothetical protein